MFGLLRGGGCRRHHPAFSGRLVVVVRAFSSREGSGGGGGGGQGRQDRSGHNNRFKLDALPFSVSPEEALERFRKWARTDQGLTYLLNSNSIRIGAAYCPVWSFQVNIRFVLQDKENGRRRLDWKPDIFSVYGNQSVVHIPGLSAYAGYNYRRSLLNAVHNTSLVFLGDQTVPWDGSWMLRNMKLANGQALPINVDPWNATRGLAFSILKQELTDVAQAQASDLGTVQVQTEIVSSRRVYMPTYIIDYKVLGVEYQSYISGADAGAGVSGISHKVWNVSDQDFSRASQSFLSQAAAAVQTSARVLGGRHLGVLLVSILQLVGSLAGRLLLRLPIVGAFAGLFVGFRKVIQPWIGARYDAAQWERQREHEATMEDRFDHQDDFVDSGPALRYFQANRQKILRHLSGETQHETGDFDWYKEWEEWARRVYSQQQQQQQQQSSNEYYQNQQQQQQQQRRTQQRQKAEYQWDFDVNNPYSVLGISRGASKTEVSAAFRREMLKYHPDTIQATASDAEKERATERSKLISAAYRQIKSQMK
jgi:negative regulator of genetic competence, sporulation and motility